mmetsp:Transcript_71627/g.180763  ORF Transcript_71627/g.180763 Transcript_71627/m.180763 type:complete len:281 (+) Transcript_71627:172-1014(+)
MPGESFLDRFWCCCVASSGGQQVGAADEHAAAFGGGLLFDSDHGIGGSSAIAVAHEGAAFPLSSGAPRFPGAQEPALASAAASHPASASSASSAAAVAPSRVAGGNGEGDHQTAHGFGFGLSDAQTGQAAVVMSAEEKEREKARLQKLVKEFAKEAVTGIAVSLVTPGTGAQTPYFFQMDRYLTVFSLQPKDGSNSTAEATLQCVNVRDLTQIYKGADVAMRAPGLGRLAGLCVGLDTTRADRQLFFCFDEPLERDKFYTCLKILRMSVDIHRSDHADTP